MCLFVSLLSRTSEILWSNLLNSTDNALIARLDGTDRAHFLHLCEKFPLSRSACLFDPGESIDHVYFPVDGFVCLLAHEPETPELIIAMVGREGMLDPRAALGIARTPVRAPVQSEGWAWRMPTEIFQQQLEANVALKRLMDRYVAVVLNQSATLALCLRFHEVGARLARWLLMSQDRTGSSRCQVTQEALGSMLGVRRVSVTTAAHALQQRGAIRYHRGDIHVLDRTMLEETACTCYRADRESYEALLK
ncbi:MAG: Crp/Fnr family transcriptional regulator [Pseudomonas sp.]|nr:MAG: Crp/Fnr family transcriptional regulator [Pseudomonas sp.]